MSELLQGYLTGRAERDPNATAMVMGDERSSYGELEVDSNRIANMLRAVGCERGDRVCLLTPKSIDAVAAMHGALKADCAYVPIDTDTPAARAALVIRAADPRVLLVSEDAKGMLDGLADAGAIGPSTIVGSLGAHLSSEHYKTTFASADLAQQDGTAPAAWNTAGDLAHILFTSGSTGVPKGVMITHANVTAFVSWANGYFGPTAQDRWSGHPPLHFDLSTYDIYGALESGAELHLLPARLSLLPHKLTAYIRDARLTRWFSVPSILSYLVRFDAIRPGDFPSLRQLLWCGEVLPTPVLKTLMERLPHVTFTNLYGPTEATIASSYHTVTSPPADETVSVPIGVACDGEELLILDEAQREVGTGVTGDLYIGGVGLSPGYWRDDARTSDAFVADPRSQDTSARIYRTGDIASWTDSGLAQFHGRADAQIKHRGYRIELGEIEAALNALDDVRECAVVGVPTDGFEGTAICCAFSAADGVSVPALRGGLRERLPSYMVPSRWHSLPGLPKNVNGKIDRKAVTQWFMDDDKAVDQ